MMEVYKYERILWYVVISLFDITLVRSFDIPCHGGVTISRANHPNGESSSTSQCFHPYLPSSHR